MAANAVNATNRERLKSGRPRRLVNVLQAGFGLALLLVWSSCGKKTEVKNGLSELEKTFPAASAPTSVPQATPSSLADPAPYVQAAISAAHNNEYAKGVMALESAQRAKGTTPQQLMAIEKAKQALTAELLARASRGDPKAKAELEAIEKTRSQ
jgi:hypothetical protein